MVTGNFKSFILFTTVIIIHELGHVLAALYYKWNIEKVILLPFGALTLFHEKINKPIKEEFIILITGPLFQIVGTYFLNFYSPDVIKYSALILGFNLLPIVPLDGAKFVNIILNKLISFKKSHIFTVYISFITIIILLLKVEFSLLFTLMIVFISIKVYDEYKNHENLFNLFLLERYTYKFKFPRKKIIKGIKLSKMQKDYNHIFYEKGNYLTERQMLEKRFDFKYKLW